MDELSSLLKDTFGFFSRHLTAICQLVLPCLIPLNLLYAFAGSMSSDLNQVFWLTTILGLLVYPLYQGALIVYMTAFIAGKTLTRAECYRASLRYWRPLFLLSVMTSLAFAVGLFAFILPGLYIVARLAFAEFYCVLEGQEALASMHKSWQETKDKLWLILSGGITIMLVITLPFELIDVGIKQLQIGNPVFTFVLSTLESLLMVLLTIFSYRVFTLIKHNKIS